MADLDVIALLVAKPGQEDVLRGALTDLVAATKQEEGCLAYSLGESAATPGTFVTIEKWRGQADLDAHMQTPHVAKAFEVAGEALASAPAIHPLTPVA